MERKICTRCNVEKNTEYFYNKYTECKFCNSYRSLKRYNENKDKIPNRKKFYYGKKQRKIITQTKQ